MSLLDFKKRFNQEIDLEEVRRNFVTQVNHFIVEPLDTKIGNYYFSEGNPLFDFICLGLNLTPSSVINSFNRNNYGVSSTIPSLRNLTKDNFETTLIVIELAFEYFSTRHDYDKERWVKIIDNKIKFFLNQILSLKIYWYEGRFYPEGAEELDEKLVKDNLTWLEECPRVKEIFRNALDHYSQIKKEPIKGKDAISNSFQAVESLSRVFINTDKSFDNVFNELTEKLGLISQWKNIFNYYKEISKEFGRHSGRNKDFIPKEQDVEAFIYLSGLIMRLILFI